MSVVRPWVRRCTAAITANSLAIEGAGGLVEQQHWGIFEEGPGQVDSLFFADAQPSGSVTDTRIISLRQLQDERMGLGGVSRGLDLGTSGPVAAKSDVFGDRRRQKQGSCNTHDTCRRRLS